MYIYLAGPEGDEQLATKRLLIERGYRVSCATDVASREYAHNKDLPPSERDVARNRMWEMMHCDAVVVEEGVGGAEAWNLVQACKFSGLALVHADELPLWAPGCSERDAVIDALDLLTCEEEVATPTVKDRVLQRLHAASDWFTAKCGWFFTNGNKTAQPTPRPYPAIELPTTTTA